MIIPYTALSEEALQALLEDFVTRDGTDYGWQEMSMQEKANHLFELLRKGELLISYDEETESCGLVMRGELPRQ